MAVTVFSLKSKNVSTTVLHLFLCLFAIGQNANRSLLFSEEFSDSLSYKRNWKYSYPWGRSLCANREQQLYTDSGNLKIENGIAYLIAKKEVLASKNISYEKDSVLLCDSIFNFRYWNFSSGMLFSNEKYYTGYFEIKFKLPKGNGLWPAFWLYGDNSEEIDVFEIWCNKTNELSTNIHYLNDKHIHKKDFKFKRNFFSDNWNVLAVEWTKDSVFWYLNNDKIRSLAYPFKSAMNIIVNLAVTPEIYSPVLFFRKTKFPAVMEIDYIRVYN